MLTVGLLTVHTMTSVGLTGVMTALNSDGKNVKLREFENRMLRVVLGPNRMLKKVLGLDFAP